MFPGLGTPRAVVKPPQYPNLETLSRPRPQDPDLFHLDSFSLGAEGSRDPRPASLRASGDAVRTRPAAEARPPRARATYAGQWALLPASVRADPSPPSPPRPAGDVGQPFPSHLPVTSAPQDASFKGSLGDARDPDLEGPR